MPKLKIPRSYCTNFYSYLCGMNMPTVIATPFSARRIANLDDIKMALKEIYNKGVPFAHTSRPSLGTHPGMLDPIAERIHNYFVQKGNKKNNQSNFDKFHKELCDDFITIYNRNKAPADDDPADDDPTYGNAQKLINVAFKYLSCYSDYDTYADLFSYCHIPLDNNILCAINDVFVEHSIEEIFSSKIYISQGNPEHNARLVVGGNRICWSELNYDQYITLVSIYRLAMAGKIGDHCWLTVDFHYWSTGPSLIGGRFKYISSPLPATPPVTPISKFYM